MKICKFIVPYIHPSQSGWQSPLPMHWTPPCRHFFPNGRKNTRFPLWFLRSKGNPPQRYVPSLLSAPWGIFSGKIQSKSRSRPGCYCWYSAFNVSKLSCSKRYARETGREAIGKGLRIFPVSRSRIPKISEFC